MNLLEISESLSIIKTRYMSLSKNAIFRYARIVQSAGGEENRYVASTRDICDASEAKDLYERLTELELDLKKIKDSLTANYDIKTAKTRPRKIGCSSCGRKREQ